MAMIGEITLWGAKFEPTGWRFCDGSKLDQWSSMKLYSVIGDTYGSYSRGGNFELPNIDSVKDKDGRGESKYIICIDGDYPIPSS